MRVSRAAKQRERYHADPTARRAYQSVWQEANAEKQRRYLKAWRLRKVLEKHVASAGQPQAGGG